MLTAINREVLRTNAQQKGDYKPICFPLTDGEPTGNCVVACGPDPNTEVARHFAGVVQASGLPHAIKDFFKITS